MKDYFCTVSGIVGSSLVCFFGKTDVIFKILCIFLVTDYLCGLIVATVFKKSKKTESGKLSSSAGFKGLCKKIFVLVLVGVANLLDVALGTEFIRYGVMISFITNETISIIENAGLMGVKIPNALKKAIDILTEKEENNNGNKNDGN